MTTLSRGEDDAGAGAAPAGDALIDSGEGCDGELHGPPVGAILRRAIVVEQLTA